MLRLKSFLTIWLRCDHVDMMLLRRNLWLGWRRPGRKQPASA
jgi:hypothetical protein